MKALIKRIWKIFDTLPLRLKSMWVTSHTASTAIIVLAALLAATVGPRELGFWGRGFWLTERLYNSGFILMILVLLVITMGLQFWLTLKSTTVLTHAIDLERDGEVPDSATIHKALDELVAFPLKSAGMSLALWWVTAVLWYIGLSIAAALPDHVNLFISAGIFCEGALAAPYQYHLFKLQIERDYFRLYDYLEEPYFPTRFRFATLQTKLSVSISFVVVFSLLVLFASNTLLAWEGLKRQTSEVGEQLLNSTALGIGSIRREFEIEQRLSQERQQQREFEMQYDDYLAGSDAWGATPQPAAEAPMEIVPLKERVSEHLGEVEDRVGQSYYLFSSDGTVNYGSTQNAPEGILQRSIDAIAAASDQGFLQVESPETQDIFLATAIAWPDGSTWYLGTFYRGADVRQSLWDIIWVSGVLIAFMFLVCLLTAFLIARDSSHSLNQMAKVASRVSGGDLSNTMTRIVSEDEIGFLANSLTVMFNSFRQTVQAIDSSAQSVEIATGEMAEISGQVSEGAETQVGHSKDATENVNVLSASIKSIEENIEVLTSSADESSTNIFEMGTTIDEVATSVSQLFDSVDDSTSVVTEMVASIRQVASSVESVSEIAADTAQAMEAMTDAIRLVEKDAADTREISDRAANGAQAGALAVQQTIEGIQEIRASVSEANGVIEKLNVSSESIGNILNYISDVADQTNLLSLNAGIIAAQAGEHGKGFAVIAKEVSTLAERTTRYTREIEKLIQEVQVNAKEALVAMAGGSDAVEKGVELSSRAGSALQEILQSAGKASERVANIATTASRQSESAIRVARAIDEVNRMTQQIEKATQEQSRGSERILHAGERMRDIAGMVKKTTSEQAHNSKQITKAIENINDMVRYINDAQRKEVTTCARVSELVDDINRVTLQNFDHAMDMDRAVEVLRRNTGTLKEQVAQFKLTGNGKNGGRPRSTFRDVTPDDHTDMI
ncbi:MAG: HAMP domain-containing protein [Chrysiogenetes bacterium]|nr:HAMP domain-containing protein [Chrysiogenetes bacterium]